MPDLTILINYVSWFIFTFVAIVWFLELHVNKRDIRTPTTHAPSSYPRLSIIVPAYNEEATLGKTIESLLHIAYPAKKREIIIVNDASTDRTEAIARSFRKQGVRVLTNAENRGKAFSLNRGISASKGNLIACMDADSIIDRDAVSHMLPYFDNPRVGAVTPALRVWEPHKSLERIQHIEYILNVLLRKILGFMDSIAVTPGAFTIYRRGVLTEVKGFDEHNLTEDMDVALKIQEKGYTIENVLSAVAYTACPTSWGELYRQRLRWYRGAISNSIRYKHLFFKEKYGNLGMFFLPMNFASIIAVILVFATMVWSFSWTIYNFVWGLYLTGWDTSMFMQYLTFGNISIGTPIIMGVLGMGIGSYILFRSMRIGGERLMQNKRWFFIYLFCFPIPMMLFWSMAFLFELFNVKKSW